MARWRPGRTVDANVFGVAAAPIAQLAEAADLKSAKCRFESDWGHRRVDDRPTVCEQDWMLATSLTVRRVEPSRFDQHVPIDACREKDRPASWSWRVS